MTYCTTDQARTKVPFIKTSPTVDTTYDVRLSELRTQYFPYINGKLAQYTSTPVPASHSGYNILTLIEALYVAGQFCLEKADAPGGGMEEKGQTLIDRADKLLEDFINDYFLQPQREDHLEQHFGKQWWEDSDDIVEDV